MPAPADYAARNGRTRERPIPPQRQQRPAVWPSNRPCPQPDEVARRMVEYTSVLPACQADRTPWQVNRI
jgi:hypothetical protein